LRTSDGFVENFGPDILARVASEAPEVRLRFVPKTDRSSIFLREGGVDLETGVIGETMAPEIRTQGLFRDRYIGAVRPGHPLARGKITMQRFAAGQHVLVSRRGSERGPVDDALESQGLKRRVMVIVGGFSAALGLARVSDLIASVPERHTLNLRAGLHSFPLPVSPADITISMFWHPRLDADSAHRWLRGCIHEVCAEP
jgi:DNA-binding transcriptional LysR family regulator